MGKCAKCQKRIEYNNFVVVNGIVYHKECAPKKEADPEVVKAEEEAEEQFLKDMAEVSELKEEVKESIEEEKYNPETTKANGDEKKPRKKRSKKND